LSAKKGSVQNAALPWTGDQGCGNDEALYPQSMCTVRLEAIASD